MCSKIYKVWVNFYYSYIYSLYISFREFQFCILVGLNKVYKIIIMYNYEGIEQWDDVVVFGFLMI